MKRAAKELYIIAHFDTDNQMDISDFDMDRGSERVKVGFH